MDGICKVHLSEAVPMGIVEELPVVRNSTYDHLLSENIIFLHLLAGVANNTVLECIVRATPLVINRHSGPEFYLGANYPLFFDDLREVPHLLSPENIFRAHEYLCRLDKTWMHGRVFAESVAAACVACNSPSEPLSFS